MEKHKTYSIFNFQFSTFNFQFSTFNFPLSTFHFPLSILLLLLLASCSTLSTHHSSLDTQHTPLPTLDKEAVWQLVSLAGRPVPQSTVITLQFNPEAGTLRGQSTCNTFCADYTLSQPPSHSATQPLSHSATLKLSHLTHTDIQCAEAQMNTEERFLALLAKTNQLSLSPDGWTLTLSAKGRNPLVFSLQ